MATARKRGRGSPAAAAAAAAVAAIEAADDTADETENVSEEQAAAEAEIKAAAETTGETRNRRPVIRLYRSHPALGGREAYCDELDVNVFSRHYVRQNYGGGRFRAETVGPGRDNKMSVRSRETFEIDLALAPKHPAALLGGGGENGAAPAPAPAASPSSVLDQAVAALLLTMVQSVQETGKMQAQMMADHSAVLHAQLKTMQTAPAERDPVETFRQMADIMKPAQREGSPLSVLKEMLELQELMSAGSGKGEVSALGALTELGPKVLETVNRALDQRGHPAPATLHQPDGRPVVDVPQPKPEAVPVSVDVVGMLGKWVPYLKQWAEENRSAAWAAETISYQVPAGYHAALVAVLAPEDAAINIVGAYPALVPFADWVAELRTELLALLSEQPDDADTDP